MKLVKSTQGRYRPFKDSNSRLTDLVVNEAIGRKSITRDGQHECWYHNVRVRVPTISHLGPELLGSNHWKEYPQGARDTDKHVLSWRGRAS